MTRKLTDWDAELPESILQNQQKLCDRRLFFSQITSIATTAALLPVIVHAGVDRVNSSFLQQQPWKTFAVVQEHLFPAGKNSPGAKDINATLYLKNTLDTPDMEKEDREFILNGVKWLDAMSNEMKGKPFINLQAEGREIVLRHIEKSSAGENWLATIILYITEALLADPVYGGNPGGIGWKWLQHQPGFPRPPEDKMYYKL